MAVWRHMGSKSSCESGVSCLPTCPPSTSPPQVCAAKLQEFVTHEDPNLKYLGLVALAVLQQADRALVEGSRDIVLACITTDDSSVRSQARSE
jgi:hypothetical protein